jgi:Sortase domain
VSRRRVLAVLSAALASLAVVVLGAPLGPASTGWAGRVLHPGDRLVEIGAPGPFTDPRLVMSPTAEGAMPTPTTDTTTDVATPASAPAARPAPTPKPPATHTASAAILAPTPRPTPVRVTIEGTGIAGPVVPTGIDGRTGEFAVPPDAGRVGWYEYGPRPGERGSAVLAGHLDWKHRPGVFLRLTKVRRGAIVAVTFSDRSVRRFTITDVRLVPKPQLPTATVFARTGPPAVRLITCGGEFDRSSHHYKSNVLVMATPRR